MYYTKKNTMCKSRISIYLWILVFICLNSLHIKIYAQNSSVDTLIIGVKEIEELFLKNNLSLIAEHFEIEKAEAAIIQAKLWPNPEIGIDEVQLFTPKDTDEIPGLWNSNFWKNRTFSLEVEQSIPINGERKHQVAFQKLEKENEELKFKKVLLELKKELHILIAEWNYNYLLYQDIQMHLNKITALKSRQYLQYKSGEISKVEYFRIEALYHTVLKETKDIKVNLISLENDLKEILVIPFTTPIKLKDEKKWLYEANQFELLDLDSYYKNTNQESIHFLQLEKQYSLHKQQIKIEESRGRIPDLKLKGMYDRGSGTHINFFGLGLAIDLPVFDRNQGNRKIAYWELEKQKVLQKQFYIEWEKDITNVYSKLIENKNLLDTIYHSGVQEVEELMQSLHENLNLKNISLIEFLDYFEAFKESKENYYSLLLEIYTDYQNLKYLISQEN